MKTGIVWFKTDLRITDNETLVKAISQNEQIVPIYCFDPRQWKTTETGFKKTGSFRTQFLFESLIDLNKQLEQLGSHLLVVKGLPEEVIPQLAVKYEASKVYAKREVGFEEKQIETAVETALWKQKSELERISTNTLYHAEDLPFSIKNIPEIFTEFRKKIEKESSIRPIFERPTKINSPLMKGFELLLLAELGLEKGIVDERAALQFKGGETEAINRLNHYFFDTKALANYKETRNGLIGADYSSKFSAWLSLGCLSPRFIYHKIKEFESEVTANDSTYWLVFELLWRDYFRFMMKKHQSKFFQKGGIQGKQLTSTNDSEKVHAWINGETGVDFVDANMRELKLTGFMSNRGRQNVASYFCNELNLDWRIGAAYFEEQLIDYDVCSNWGNWAYLAGVGNDPRGNRAFNIEKQANDYDKKGEYRRLWME
jgi:deoxyribodipyrimidine photo-lyase